jgi:hypothetical protein
MPTPASSTYSLPTSKDSGSVDTDAETPVVPISVADTGDHGEGGKLKMIVQLVKRVLGVKDIAAMCVVALSFDALSHPPPTHPGASLSQHHF